MCRTTSHAAQHNLVLDQAAPPVAHHDMSWLNPAFVVLAESKHPAWHNQLPFMRAANTTIEQLIVNTLNAKGYASSAPYDSAAWRAKLKQHSAAMMGEEYIGSDGTECARLRYRSIRSVCV
jgi:hypothetical protein